MPKRKGARAAKRKLKLPLIAVLYLLIAVIAVMGVLYFANKPLFDKIVLTVYPEAYGGGGKKALTRSDGELQIHFLDVGQGDCILIRFPDGKNMMIDGGEKTKLNAEKITNYLGEQAVTRLDYALLTHTDSDHCGSFDDALKAVSEVGTVYLPKIKSENNGLGLSDDYKTKDTQVYDEFVTAAKNSNAEIVFTEDVLEIETETYRMTMYCRSDGYYKQMSVTDAHDLNDVSPVCVLEYNGVKSVFTGDANNSSVSTSSEKNFLSAMNNAEFDADVLKIGHHGGKDSSGSDFLSYVKAEYAVVCVGEKNGGNSYDDYDIFISDNLKTAGDFTVTPNTAYGHPSEEVCSETGRLSSTGIKEAYYTLLNGDIVCAIDKDGKISFICDKAASENEGVITFAAYTVKRVYYIIGTRTVKEKQPLFYVS